MTATVTESRRLQLESAIAGLDPIMALLCLVQQTGDRTLLRRFWNDLDGTQDRVDRFVGRIGDEPRRVSAAVDAEIRKLLLEALLPGTPPMMPRPDAALFAQMGCLATGFDVRVDQAEYFMEQAGFVTDRRDVPAKVVPPEGFEVLVIGAGMVGINAGIKLAAAGFSYRILDSKPEVGGTWWINRYPNAAVDTPALGYSYSFEPNVQWSRYYPTGPEYFEYLNRVADKYGIRERIEFETTMTACDWDEESQRWTVTARRGDEEITYRANAVITALGHLNRPFIPRIENQDAFGGLVVHTTEWTPETDGQVAGRSVVVVGTGCTSAQLATGIADSVSHLTVLQRQTQWYMPNDRVFCEVPADERASYECIPFSYQWARARTIIEQATRARDYLQFDPEWNERTGGFSEANDRMRDIGLDYLAKSFPDRPDLIEKLTPDFPPFAKRPIIDPGYLETLRKPGVDLVSGELKGFEKDGVVLSDGTHIPCEVVVLATGFTLDYLRAPHTVRGREGVTIAKQWAEKPEAYLGLMAPGFPNLFITSGPNSGASGSGHSMMGEEQVHYVIGALQTMVNEGITSIDVTAEATRTYCAEIDERIEQTVWKRAGKAHGYFRQAGHVVLGYPKPNFEYWCGSRRPDLDDFTVIRAATGPHGGTSWHENHAEPVDGADLDLSVQPT
ncbi:MAG: NAD(P)/FAD-dependent oxidoreductase [Actinomycetota bacterium]|nr:NAD(P)/FAD-dependent oxidoreductase [Actinomycetota bacterium]